MPEDIVWQSVVTAELVASLSEEARNEMVRELDEAVAGIVEDYLLEEDD